MRRIKMEVKYGYWKIKTGKGDRVYLNYSNEDLVMHPDELCKNAGLGFYQGFDVLKNLAICILKFEKQKQNASSIIGIFEED
jgi:hypothetical protein